MNNKVNLPHDYKVYIPLVFLFLFILFLLPRSGRFNYDYKKGSPWIYETLIAEFDFPILKTDAQLQEEREKAGSSVIPYYKYSNEVSDGMLMAVETADLGDFNAVRPEIQRVVADICVHGIVSDADEPDATTEVIYIQKDKRASKYPSSDVYNVSEARNRLLMAIRHSEIICDADSLCKASGLYDIIVPNLIYDRETTDLVHDETFQYISTTSGVVNAGQIIVSKGEMVTAEIEQLLDSYKSEYESSLGYSGSKLLLWTGNVILALAIVLLLFFTIFYSNNRVFEEFNRYCYLLLVFFLSFLTSFLVEKADPKMMYMIPFSLVALFLMAFFKKRVVFPVYMISLLPLLVFSHNGTELFLMYLVAGVIAIFSFGYFNKGWQQFVTAFFVFLSLLIVYVALRLIEGIEDFNDYTSVIYMALSALLSVAGYPLIYLFEKLFRLVSNSRLIELSDTNNKPLRELAHKAPGTFQHSLQVMNMSDAVARSIGANVPLVRAGALYHDIGKTLNPQCFIENETLGAHYHEQLSPQESAKEIIKHVADGLSLADKYKLPGVVKDFILTHHGTTCTAFFYNKFIKEGGNPEDAGLFYYNGKRPVTKEQIIIMLCDTLEAASRSLKDYSAESISELVERIIKSKMSDGQFEEADISLKELNVIKNVLKSYLQQVYHARVAYPKDRLSHSK